MSLMTMQRGERARTEAQSPFILLAEHQDRLKDATRVSWFLGAVFGFIIGLLVAAFTVAHAQTVPPPAPMPSSYTFTFTPENTDNLYAALERASQAQALVTGERSPRFDALESQIRTDVLAQKAAAAKVAEKPKDEPKP